MYVIYVIQNCKERIVGGDRAGPAVNALSTTKFSRFLPAPDRRSILSRCILSRCILSFFHPHHNKLKMQTSALVHRQQFSGTPVRKSVKSSARSLPSQTTVTAIFKTKTKKVVEDPAPAPKKSLFSFGGKKVATPAASSTKTTKKSSKVDKAALYEKKRGSLNRIVGSFDLAEVRSKSDAELLYDAKYGKLQGGKMSREQYGALRRKIGGTAKDYWKDWVEVKGEYTDKGYVAKDQGTNVPALGFLVIVVVALLGTTAAVVTQF